MIVSGSATTTFSGSIGGAGGGIGLEKLGSGTLILSGTDSYQLGTTVEGGTLIVTQAGGLADQSNLTVGNPSSFGAVIPDAAANGTPTSDAAPVPEPGTLALLAAGAMGLLGEALRWRRA